MVWLNADAAIFYRKTHFVAAFFPAHYDFPTLWRIAHSVADQIAQGAA